MSETVLRCAENGDDVVWHRSCNALGMTTLTLRRCFVAAACFTALFEVGLTTAQAGERDSAPIVKSSASATLIDSDGTRDAARIAAGAEIDSGCDPSAQDRVTFLAKREAEQLARTLARATDRCADDAACETPVRVLAAQYHSGKESCEGQFIVEAKLPGKK